MTVWKTRNTVCTTLNLAKPAYTCLWVKWSHLLWRTLSLTSPVGKSRVKSLKLYFFIPHKQMVSCGSGKYSQQFALPKKITSRKMSLDQRDVIFVQVNAFNCTWVVFQCFSSISFLDLWVRTILGQRQDFIIIFSLAFL